MTDGFGKFFDEIRAALGPLPPKKRRWKPPVGPVVEFPSTLVLTDTERHVIEFISRSRYNHDRQAGIQDQRVQEDLHGWVRDLYGFAAEYVFAKAVGVMADFDTKPRSGGVDAKLVSDITVDVKGTSHATGRLICPLKDTQKLAADIFVLVTVEMPITRDGRQILHEPAGGTVQGWAWAEDLLDPRAVRGLRKRDNGDVVDTYVISRSALFRTLPLTTRPRREDYPCVHDLKADPGVDRALGGLVD